MRNQPKYNFFKNASYALEGIKDLVKTETSFQIELVLALLLLPVLISIDVTLIDKIVMFITLLGMLIAEAMNSAIERVVDLVTLDHHIMAGRAKDVGSAVVLLSVVVFVVVWTTLLYDKLF